MKKDIAVTHPPSGLNLYFSADVAQQIDTRWSFFEHEETEDTIIIHLMIDDRGHSIIHNPGTEPWRIQFLENELTKMPHFGKTWCSWGVKDDILTITIKKENMSPKISRPRAPKDKTVEKPTQRLGTLLRELNTLIPQVDNVEFYYQQRTTEDDIEMPDVIAVKARIVTHLGE